MRSNVRIAKELVRIAKQPVAWKQADGDEVVGWIEGGIVKRNAVIAKGLATFDEWMTASAPWSDEKRIPSSWSR